MEPGKRRCVLVLAVVLAVLLTAAPQSYAQISNRYFKVEVKGTYGEVPDVLYVDFGALTVPAVPDTPAGNAGGQKSYRYGTPEPLEITMVYHPAPGNVKIQAWGNPASTKRNPLRRDVIVYLLDKSKTNVLATYSLPECLPISLESGNQFIATDVPTMTLRLQANKIVSAESTMVVPQKGDARLTLNGTEMPIKSHTGGAVAADGSISPVTVNAYSTPCLFLAQVNKIRNLGQDLRFELTLPDASGKPVTYGNCLLTNFRLTPFHNTGGEELKETVVFQPELIRGSTPEPRKPRVTPAGRTGSKKD